MLFTFAGFVELYAKLSKQTAHELPPQSTLASTGIYVFPANSLGMIEKYISRGNNPDKTGSFIEWLYKQEKVFVFVTEKTWHDIGTKEQLIEVDKNYLK